MELASSLRQAARSARADLLPSVVVFLVALPLCMGIAIASGVPPSKGIITGIVGGLVVGVLAGSPLQVSGPAAGLTVLIWDLVQRYGLSALGMAVLLAGALQVVAALLRAGKWFRAVSPAVILGMLAGIGVLILASQFHVMLDDKPKGSGLDNLLSIPVALWDGLFPFDGSQHHLAAGIGIVTLVVLTGWTAVAPKRFQMIPGALVGVFVASVVASLFKLPIKYVAVPDSLLAELAPPALTTLQLMREPAFLAEVLGLAIIASAETLLCAVAVDKMHDGPRTHYDRELLAQGIGNAICGLVGALPMTGVIVRSSANVQAGGKTRASAILHGVWLLLLVAVFPQVLAFVPTASLAAVLVYTGYKLAHPRVIPQLARYGRGEVLVFLVTVVGIVVFDLLKGVAAGFVLAGIKNQLALAYLHADVAWDEDRKGATLHLGGTATFLSLPRLAAVLESLPRGLTTRIDFTHLSYIDAACLDLMESYQRQQQAAGGTVAVDWDTLRTKNHPMHMRKSPASGASELAKGRV